tara:strand:- start:2193 stop:2396 length:204 start_codon:yes stop_codon:yes gene_type:complete
MTTDDINNSNTSANVNSSDCVQRIDGVTSSWTETVVNARVEKSIWDAALASADDALVLVQWLESLRP